jgi:uncharacterized protein YoxC
MTMSPVEVERKVRQLDNDVQALYTLVNSISTTQQRHTNRLFELAATLDSISGQVAAIGQHGEALADKFDALGGKVDTLSQRGDSVESKVDALGQRVGSVDGKVDALGGRVDSVDGKVDAVLDLLRGASG